MSHKLPAILFYVDDYIRDMATHPCDVRGAWMTILSYLWKETPKGRATYSLSGWARLLGETETETGRLINILGSGDHPIANITHDARGEITIVNRRMIREEEQRTRARDRKRRQRAKCGNVLNMEALSTAHAEPSARTEGVFAPMFNDTFVCSKCGEKTLKILGYSSQGSPYIYRGECITCGHSVAHNDCAEMIESFL